MRQFVNICWNPILWVSHIAYGLRIKMSKIFNGIYCLTEVFLVFNGRLARLPYLDFFMDSGHTLGSMLTRGYLVVIQSFFTKSLP